MRLLTCMLFALYSQLLTNYKLVSDDLKLLADVATILLSVTADR